MDIHAHTHTYAHAHVYTHAHTHICVFVYLCICVLSVCVSVGIGVCEYLCICVCVSVLSWRVFVRAASMCWCVIIRTITDTQFAHQHFETLVFGIVGFVIIVQSIIAQARLVWFCSHESLQYCSHGGGSHPPPSAQEDNDGACTSCEREDSE